MAHGSCHHRTLGPTKLGKKTLPSCLELGHSNNAKAPDTTKKRKY